MAAVRNIVIMGAAGRDFHDFNTLFRDDPTVRVRAFTAYQIPGIAGRTYPAELAGERYPEGIPILDEAELADVLERFEADEVVFAYSDISYQDLMHRASLVNALGCDFRLLSARRTMLSSRKPVISVCAVRTGVGKSQTSRRVAEILRARGQTVVVVRHPMPYDPDLNHQRCERLATYEDLERYRCTIEEREEYEVHINNGFVVYAGVDYQEILRNAEEEADVVLWDGGNNDTSFFVPDLQIVMVDPHRPGHELRYYPGETNLRLADVVLVAKVGTASADGIAEVSANAARLNPGATLIEADSVVTVDDPAAVAGKRVLVVEDGPTLTHGEMRYGAGIVAARKYGASAIVDPRPTAVGALRDTFEKYPHLTEALPAMGYGDAQVRDLQASINATDCDVVLVGTPFDLPRLLECNKPMVRVKYELDDGCTAMLTALIDEFLTAVSA